MSWLEGTIVEFHSSDPKYRELRKIRTDPRQSWERMHFFHLDQARLAGYPDSLLAEGCTIRFEPDGGASRPKVARFQPRDRPPRQGGGSGFHNPYHFIPLEAPPPDSLTAADPWPNDALFHDRFGASGPGADAVFSGRIVCLLETEGPVVVGGRQQEDRDGETETLVHPFELADPEAPDDDARKRPAIPGSSLRGLISSLVEAASCSAMRVLANRRYTRRSEIRGESFSRVGLLVDDGGVLKLRPLTVSIDEMTHPQGRLDPRRCRILLNGYGHGGGETRAVPSSFLAGRPQSTSATHREYWYADLSNARPHRSRGQFVIGLDLPEPPIPEREWAELSEAQRACYPDRGVLLVLGLDGSKAKNLPPTKKHEYFIPYPPERDREPLLPIPEAVLEELRRLARDAADLPRGGSDDDFPYLHAGRRRGGHYVEPEAGDLVYYETDPRGRMTHLAYSSIWRRPVAGDLHGSVALESPDLVPFHPDRRHLTLAERLFGFVEAGGRRGLAGRLRFAHALALGAPPEGSWYEPSVPLKILATPKPPSPALYFGQGGYLSGRELDLTQHKPQGRKVYLHHRRQEIESGAWQSHDLEKRKLKMRVTPLKTGTRFLFHVDFHNLGREEVGFLLFALRPAEGFRHKLGLGKPLGLGQVRIDPLALAFIDRRACYAAESLFAAKYQSIEAPLGAGSWPELRGPLARRYLHEGEAIAAGSGRAEGFPSREELVAGALGRIPTRVRAALELVGDPSRVLEEVTYPVLRGQDSEGEHYQWFVQNNRRHREALAPLEAGRPLPVLPRHPRG